MLYTNGEDYIMSNALQTTNPKDLARINSTLKAISAEMTKQELIREIIKESIDFINEEFDIPKSIVRRLAKTYHARDFIEQQSLDTDFVDAYETLVSVDNRLA